MKSGKFHPDELHIFYLQSCGFHQQSEAAASRGFVSQNERISKFPVALP
jgi:hypothetical protein